MRDIHESPTKALPELLQQVEKRGYQLERITGTVLLILILAYKIKGLGVYHGISRWYIEEPY